MGRKKAAIYGQIADTDLKLLRVFKTVVEKGGFTASEIELNLANSTISNYISDLEKRLDMRLCERGRKGFKLTHHGKMVYQATLELLNALGNFQNKINSSHNRILGEIHIAITEHMIGHYQSKIADTLSKFTTLAPDVTIKITTMESDNVTSTIIDERADIGITVTPAGHEELHTHALFEETMTLFCAKSHPLYKKSKKDITPENIAKFQFVESPRLMPGREIHADMKRWNKHANAHHQEARAALILSGNYLGFLPEHLVKQLGLTNQLKPIHLYSYKNEISMICRKNKLQEVILDTFYSCIL